MEKVSAVLITLNEEKRIRPTLESLRWVDEIVVLDFQSTDRTAEICREYTDKVFQEPWDGYVNGRNRALELAGHPWILSVDADERVTPELQQEIRHLLSGDATRGVDGFMIPRRMYYLGKWIRHSGWYPDAKLRLYRLQGARWVGGSVHEKCTVPGKVKRLRSNLNHYSFESLGQHIEKINHYTDLYARDRFRQGRTAGLPALLLEPPAEFLKNYIIRLGFLDGIAGLTICLLRAMTIYVKKTKLRDLHRLGNADASGTLKGGADDTPGR